MTVNNLLRRGLPAGMVVLLAALSLHAAAADTYYRWKDERGNTVLSDRPPAARIDYEMISSGSPLMQPASGQNNVVPQEPEPVKRIEQVTKTPNTKIETSREACEIARKNLETLNTFARVTVTNDSGGISYLGDEAKEAQRNSARALIEKHCNQR